MKKNRDKYEVGHGKPPVHSRFKKGKSGNPNGRPRKPKTFALFEEAVKAALLDEILINGQRMPKYQVVAEALVNDAIRGKGNARAMLMPTILTMNFDDTSADGMTPHEEDKKMFEDLIMNYKRPDEEEP